MDLGSLKDLYLDELGMLYDAEVQMIRALPRLSEAAYAPELRETLSMHCRESRMHLERIDLIIDAERHADRWVLTGTHRGAHEAVELAADPQWRKAHINPTPPQQRAVIEEITWYYFPIFYGAAVLLIFVARGVRVLIEQRRGSITVSYPGRKVRSPRGLTILETSMRFNVPHASVCGGRARCSTCRIRIIGDCTSLPEPSKREAFVLDRVGAGSDPAIRLACQLRPEADLSFFQIFLPQITAASLRTSRPSHIGEERYLVSMFVDMRGSTKLAEKRLPFDTVFIVNRFLGAVSQAVIECGGQPNQFVGDGQLALFGLSTGPQTACRQALKAAAMIAANVDELNLFLKHDLREPVQFGIGIHAGEVIIGDIGYRDHMVFTALGDAVNVAARLQDMTKSLACEAVISEEVRMTAGLQADGLPEQEVAIRGRAEPMIIRAVKSAKTLSALISDVDVVAA
jgi:adenylate cyclase